MGLLALLADFFEFFFFGRGGGLLVFFDGGGFLQPFFFFFGRFFLLARLLDFMEKRLATRNFLCVKKYLYKLYFGDDLRLGVSLSGTPA